MIAAPPLETLFKHRFALVTGGSPLNPTPSLHFSFLLVLVGWFVGSPKPDKVSHGLRLTFFLSASFSCGVAVCPSLIIPVCCDEMPQRRFTLGCPLPFDPVPKVRSNTPFLADSAARKTTIHFPPELHRNFFFSCYFFFHLPQIFPGDASHGDFFTLTPPAA